MPRISKLRKNKLVEKKTSILPTDSIADIADAPLANAPNLTEKAFMYHSPQLIIAPLPKSSGKSSFLINSLLRNNSKATK